VFNKYYKIIYFLAAGCCPKNLAIVRKNALPESGRAAASMSAPTPPARTPVCENRLSSGSYSVYICSDATNARATKEVGRDSVLEADIS